MIWSLTLSKRPPGIRRVLSGRSSCCRHQVAAAPLCCQDWFLDGNHHQSFSSSQKGDERRAAVDPKEAGAVPGCLVHPPPPPLRPFLISNFCRALALVADVPPSVPSLRRVGCAGSVCVGRLCWGQSLVLEVIFQRLWQREALDLLKPVPTQRQAGRSPTQVH